MKKRLIALRGPSSVGKSSTLHLLYRLLLAHPDTKPIYFRAIGRKLDFIAVVTVEGASVGIFNQGDVPATVQYHLDQLVAQRCQIILCAARTKGKIEDVLKSQGRKYKLVQVHKNASVGKSHLVSNNAAAHYLATMVYAALDA